MPTAPIPIGNGSPRSGAAALAPTSPLSSNPNPETQLHRPQTKWTRRPLTTQPRCTANPNPRLKPNSNPSRTSRSVCSIAAPLSSVPTILPPRTPHTELNGGTKPNAASGSKSKSFYEDRVIEIDIQKHGYCLFKGRFSTDHSGQKTKPPLVGAYQSGLISEGGWIFSRIFQHAAGQ